MAALGYDYVFANPPLRNAVIKEAGNMKLFDDHDGFVLKPKKLMKKYKDNHGNSKVPGKLFIHMTNFSASEHVANKNKLGRVVDLAPSSFLDVKVSNLQKTLLNPTARDVIIADIIDQPRGERAKKKEAKRKQCFMTGNIKSYSRIMNDEKGLEKIQDYNDTAVGLAMMNA